jgi:hypothetical protein
VAVAGAVLVAFVACGAPRSPTVAAMQGDGGPVDPRCTPSHCEGVGTCDAHFAGFVWTGQAPARCDTWAGSGCYVRGTLYPSLERCEAAHTMCP